MDYVALFHKDDDSDFGVSFPDFPGCVTTGRTLDEAKDMAAEALALHIKGMLEDGDDLPHPSSLESITRSKDLNDNGVAFLITPKTYR